MRPLALAWAVAVAACAGTDRPGDAEGRAAARQAPAFEPAPDFELSDLDGERVRLSALPARLTIVHFWSTYRECADDLRLLDRLQRRYAAQGLRVLALAYSSGSRVEVARFLAAVGAEPPTLLCDRRTRELYDVMTFPTTYLLDHQRRIRYWMYGILDEEHWDRLIAEALANP